MSSSSARCRSGSVPGYGSNAPKAVFKLAIRARFATVEIDLHLVGKAKYGTEPPPFGNADSLGAQNFTLENN
jgi:hypothetical protein